MSELRLPPTTATQEFAELHLPDGRICKLPIIRGKGCGQNEKFLEIGELYEKTGLLTFDPGFTCTASCASKITFIDGPGGRCLYRGIRVDELARQSTYLETCYLLLYGQLPHSRQLTSFESLVKTQAMAHEKFKEFFSGFQSGAHPMAIMVAVVGALSAFFPSGGGSDPVLAARVIAKFPTLASMAYKTAIGEPIIYPRKNLSFAENFMHMMFATPVEDYTPLPVCVKALDAFMILHADHEQNASTATVRIAGSSQANPYACLAAGIASLWGPAHGGANEAVMIMLGEIGDESRIDDFIDRVKRKEARLMGFGHRVYKNFDPRAVYMRELTMQVIKETGKGDDKELRLAMELERRALSDDYFKSRKLYPNVDFYSGIMLKAIGIPISMYTVLFAMSRSIGWITHWLEMHAEGSVRIGRPRQVFVGEDERNYVPIQQRS